MKGINQLLAELYGKYWNSLIENGNQIMSSNIANPLILKVNEEVFAESDLKVMVFGQETWNWHNFSTSIEDGMNRYESFFIDEIFYQGYKKSAFWKGFNFFKDSINNHFKDKKVTYIWNNISKIGQNNGKTGVTKELRDLERAYFSVIKEELLILKPDIVIFFTGNRDGDIRFNFPDVVFKPIEMKNKKRAKKKYTPSSQVISKLLPYKSVKLYHPSYFGGFHYVKNDAVEFLQQTPL